MRNIIGNSVDKVMTALAVMLGVLSNILTNSTEAILRPGHKKLGVPLAMALLVILSVLTPGALADNCMDDVSPLDGLVCTANDVSVSHYNVIDGPTSVIAGEYITVTLQAELIANANERYDIGFFVALDGGDAKNGSCFREFLLPPLCPRNESPNCTYDPMDGPFYNAEFDEDINDTCGDLKQGVTTYRNLTPITIIAQDSDGDGIADVGTCVSWDNKKSNGKDNASCTCINDTLPGTKSKCRCEPVRIGNITILGQIIVDKVTDPSGDPQSFNFTLTGGPNNTDVSFNLTDQDAPFESEGLESGTYNLTEFLPEYWELTSVICDDGSDPSAIDLYPGEIVTCTFNNTLVFVPDPSINLTKTMSANADEDGSGDVSLGDTLTYTFNVTNTGNVDLDPVTVTDPMTGLSTISCGVTSLAPSMSTTCTATYTVTQADVNAGSIYNMATATGTPPTGDNVTDTDDENIPVPTPSMTIDKTSTLLTDADGSGDVSVNDTIEYTYTVVNTGATNLTGVTVVDDLLFDVALSDVAGDGVGFLAVGDSETGTLTYGVLQSDLGQTRVNIAEANSVQTDPETDTVTIVIPVPSMTIDKTSTLLNDADGSGDVSVGDIIEYTYTVENDGTANLTGVSVIDTPLGNVLISDVAGNGADFMEPGDIETGTLTYEILSSDLDTTITNIGTTDSDQTEPVTDDEDVPVPSPSLTINKTYELLVDADDSGDVSLGDTIQYTITATNNGTANLTNVLITDTLLLTLSCTPAQPAFLEPDESLVCTGTYVVTTEDDARSYVTNTATADSTQTGPVEDTVTIPVVQKNQRSIEISSLTADRDGDSDPTTLIGDFLITDESENKKKNELSVYIPDLYLTFEEKVGNTWVPFEEDISCEYTPSVPLIFGPDNPEYPDNEVTLSYTCTFIDSWPDKVRITVHAVVGGRVKEEFIYTDSFDFAGKIK